MAAGAVVAAGAVRTRAASSPRALLIGLASSAHQVEGGNWNNDLWFMEHAAPAVFLEKSGDACDHYHLYASDIRLFAQLGFRAYRFSIEWSRIEPEKGEFSQAQLDHYKRVAAACRDNGIAPLITLHHFSSPMWFSRAGGWESAEAPALFARYAERVAATLADLPLGYCTFNEINVPPTVKRMAARTPMLGQLQKAFVAGAHAPGFSTFLLADAGRTADQLRSAHRQAIAAVKARNGKAICGLTLAMRDHQPAPGGEDRFRAIEETDYLPYFELAAKDDFIGVQSYSRIRVGPEGELDPDAQAEKTESGSEYYPQALEETIRYAWKKTGRPILVTENGIPTKDDNQRIRYIDTALAGLDRCLADGIDVKAYFHWSAFDSFEFMHGYRHSYGLIAVDRATFARTPKRSAEHLGRIAGAK